MTLFLFFSVATHCMTKRVEKRACPKKPIVNQKLFVPLSLIKSVVGCYSYKDIISLLEDVA